MGQAYHESFFRGNCNVRIRRPSPCIAEELLGNRDSAHGRATSPIWVVCKIARALSQPSTHVDARLTSTTGVPPNTYTKNYVEVGTRRRTRAEGAKRYRTIGERRGV